MSLLDQMEEIIDAREDNYDNPLANFLRISLLWSVWRGQVFNPLDVIFMMDLMKTAREIHNHSDDTLLDKTGYTISCYERIDQLMKNMDYIGIEEFRESRNDTNAFGTPGQEIGFLFDLLLEVKAFENKEK